MSNLATSPPKDDDTNMAEPEFSDNPDCSGDGKTCGECGKIFSHPFYFSTHISIHASEKGYSLVGQCVHCGLTFSDVQIFEQHLVSSQAKLKEQNQEEEEVASTDRCMSIEYNDDEQFNEEEDVKPVLQVVDPEPEINNKPLVVKQELLDISYEPKSKRRRQSVQRFEPEPINPSHQDNDPAVEAYLMSLTKMGLTVDPAAFGHPPSRNRGRRASLARGRGRGSKQLIDRGTLNIPEEMIVPKKASPKYEYLDSDYDTLLEEEQEVLPKSGKQTRGERLQQRLQRLNQQREAESKSTTESKESKSTTESKESKYTTESKESKPIVENEESKPTTDIKESESRAERKVEPKTELENESKTDSKDEAKTEHEDKPKCSDEVLPKEESKAQSNVESRDKASPGSSSSTPDTSVRKKVSKPGSSNTSPFAGLGFDKSLPLNKNMMKSELEDRDYSPYSRSHGKTKARGSRGFRGHTRGSASLSIRSSTPAPQPVPPVPVIPGLGGYARFNPNYCPPIAPSTNRPTPNVKTNKQGAIANQLKIKTPFPPARSQDRVEIVSQAMRIVPNKGTDLVPRYSRVTAPKRIDHKVTPSNSMECSKQDSRDYVEIMLQTLTDELIPNKMNKNFSNSTTFFGKTENYLTGSSHAKPAFPGPSRTSRMVAPGRGGVFLDSLNFSGQMQHVSKPGLPPQGVLNNGGRYPGPSNIRAPRARERGGVVASLPRGRRGTIAQNTAYPVKMGRGVGKGSTVPAKTLAPRVAAKPVPTTDEVIVLDDDDDVVIMFEDEPGSGRNAPSQPEKRSTVIIDVDKEDTSESSIQIIKEIDPKLNNKQSPLGQDDKLSLTASVCLTRINSVDSLSDPAIVSSKLEVEDIEGWKVCLAENSDSDSDADESHRKEKSPEENHTNSNSDIGCQGEAEKDDLSSKNVETCSVSENVQNLDHDNSETKNEKLEEELANNETQESDLKSSKDSISCSSQSSSSVVPLTFPAFVKDTDNLLDIFSEIEKTCKEIEENSGNDSGTESEKTDYSSALKTKTGPKDNLVASETNGNSEMETGIDTTMKQTQDKSLSVSDSSEHNVDYGTDDKMLGQDNMEVTGSDDTPLAKNCAEQEKASTDREVQRQEIETFCGTSNTHDTHSEAGSNCEISHIPKDVDMNSLVTNSVRNDSKDICSEASPETEANSCLDGGNLNTKMLSEIARDESQVRNLENENVTSNHDRTQELSSFSSFGHATTSIVSLSQKVEDSQVHKITLESFSPLLDSDLAAEVSKSLQSPVSLESEPNSLDDQNKSKKTLINKSFTLLPHEIALGEETNQIQLQNENTDSVMDCSVTNDNVMTSGVTNDNSVINSKKNIPSDCLGLITRDSETCSEICASTSDANCTELYQHEHIHNAVTPAGDNESSDVVQSELGPTAATNVEGSGAVESSSFKKRSPGRNSCRDIDLPACHLEDDADSDGDDSYGSGGRNNPSGPHTNGLVCTGHQESATTNSGSRNSQNASPTDCEPLHTTATCSWKSSLALKNNITRLDRLWEKHCFRTFCPSSVNRTSSKRKVISLLKKNIIKQRHYCQYHSEVSRMLTKFSKQKHQICKSVFPEIVLLRPELKWLHFSQSHIIRNTKSLKAPASCRHNIDNDAHRIEVRKRLYERPYCSAKQKLSLPQVLYPGHCHAWTCFTKPFIHENVFFQRCNILELRNILSTVKKSNRKLNVGSVKKPCRKWREKLVQIGQKFLYRLNKSQSDMKHSFLSSPLKDKGSCVCMRTRGKYEHGSNHRPTSQGHHRTSCRSTNRREVVRGNGSTGHKRKGSDEEDDGNEEGKKGRYPCVQEDNILKCSICNVKFKLLKELLRHFLTEHPGCCDKKNRVIISSAKKRISSSCNHPNRMSKQNSQEEPDPLASHVYENVTVGKTQLVYVMPTKPVVHYTSKVKKTNLDVSTTLPVSISQSYEASRAKQLVDKKTDNEGNIYVSYTPKSDDKVDNAVFNDTGVPVSDFGSYNVTSNDTSVTDVYAKNLAFKTPADQSDQVEPLFPGYVSRNKTFSDHSLSGHNSMGKGLDTDHDTLSCDIVVKEEADDNVLPCDITIKEEPADDVMPCDKVKHELQGDSDEESLPITFGETCFVQEEDFKKMVPLISTSGSSQSDRFILPTLDNDAKKVHLIYRNESTFSQNIRVICGRPKKTSQTPPQSELIMVYPSKPVVNFGRKSIFVDMLDIELKNARQEAVSDLVTVAKGKGVDPDIEDLPTEKKSLLPERQHTMSIAAKTSGAQPAPNKVHAEPSLCIDTSFSLKQSNLTTSLAHNGLQKSPKVIYVHPKKPVVNFAGRQPKSDSSRWTEG
ncbi:protein qua-1 [Biomphalaria pfeifferi]|uniref:Protein qua-1 n=1 Tax=Biomphalaria pfeifferi TaxID=112525 RepID=A0AAD8BLW6_BIOPF|nr:protein qua-1 [Biomphalaria pfeifferi]